MSKVFIPHNPHKLDRQTQELRPSFDFSSAEEHGELVFLLSPNANPLGRDAQPLIEELHSKLGELQDDDKLLLVGSPILIALTASIAAQYSRGMLNLLQWNGHEKRYTLNRFNVS